MVCVCVFRKMGDTLYQKIIKRGFPHLETSVQNEMRILGPFKKGEQQLRILWMAQMHHLNYSW